MLNAVSGFLEPINLGAALRLNPLNNEARIAQVTRMLESDAAQAEARRLIADGIRLSPADARLYSLMGILEERAGNRQAAARYFEKALDRSPTEIQALTHSLNYALAAANHSRAVDHVEMIARRWPKYWAGVVPLLPILLADETSFAAVSRRFSQDQHLQQMLIAGLAKSPEGLSLAYRMLIGWRTRNVEKVDGLVNLVTARLVRSGRYFEAFVLFRLTREEVAAARPGYVYNGSFELPISGNPFDWQLKGQAGVDFQIVRQWRQPDGARPPRADAEGLADGRALAIRFLNNPIRFDNMVQLLRLAPGAYRLTVVYATSDLRTPKPLQIGIHCLESGRRLGASPFADGTVDDGRLTVDFEVKRNSCAMQRLAVFNEQLTTSWQNRYAGTLFIRRVGIRFTGS